jgi:hypothetical protein
LPSPQTNTVASRGQRFPLADKVTVRNLWSDPSGNWHAPLRDLSPYSDKPFFKAFHPFVGDGPECDISAGSLHLYLRPGGRVHTDVRNAFDDFVRCLPKPEQFPAEIEIEFSSLAGDLPSLPKAFKTSAVDWALSICDTILVCLDREPGCPEGEAHRVLAPLQCVFRCREEHLVEWVEFLRPRLRHRHSLSVIHPHISVGRA